MRLLGYWFALPLALVPASLSSLGTLSCGGGSTFFPSRTSGPFTVSGKVLDALEKPLPGYRVTIGDQSAISGSDGSFTIRSVTAPYDASVDDPLGGPAGLYVGLTRGNPLLSLPLRRLGAGTGSQASLAGRLPALPSNAERQVYFVSSPFEDPIQLGGTVGPASSDRYAAQFSWDSSTSPMWNGNVHILDYSVVADGTFTPSSYLGYTSFPVSLKPGDNQTVNVDSIDPVPTGLLSATLQGGSGSGGFRLRAFLRTPTDSGRYQLAETGSVGGAASLPVPLIQGAAFFLRMETCLPSGDCVAVQRSATPGGTIDFTIPQDLTPLMPATGAMNIDGTTQFVWSAPSGHRVFNFFVQPVTYEGVAGSPLAQGYQGAENDTYDVITTATTATFAPLTDLIPCGFGGQSYYWRVRAYADRVSVDDVASEHHLDWECNLSLKSPYGDCEYEGTVNWEFVSKYIPVSHSCN